VANSAKELGNLEGKGGSDFTRNCETCPDSARSSRKRATGIPIKKEGKLEVGCRSIGGNKPSLSRTSKKLIRHRTEREEASVIAYIKKGNSKEPYEFEDSEKKAKKKRTIPSEDDRRKPY